MKPPQRYNPTDVSAIELPLYNVFQSVKKLDAQTGHATIDTRSYLLLLETLHKGYMLLSAGSLLFFCEKLWLKPCHYGSSILNSQVLQDLLQQELNLIFNDTQVKQQEVPAAITAKKTPGPQRKPVPTTSNPVNAPAARGSIRNR